MPASTVVYLGLIVTLIGLASLVRPIRRLGIRTRRRALGLAAAGLTLVAAALFLPTSESRFAQAHTRLDEFVPVWHFSEYHAVHIPVPPERVYAAIRRVRADEIFLFRTLTWIRRGGRELPESILNAADREPLIDIATRTGFLILADEPPRELVLGTIVMAPPAGRVRFTADVFKQPLPPGFALAAMNFLVQADGRGGSLVSTETRVFGSSADVRRRFAAYWRIIYPGSALIRRMWLRAIRQRAVRPDDRSSRDRRPGVVRPA